MADIRSASQLFDARFGISDERLKWAIADGRSVLTFASLAILVSAFYIPIVAALAAFSKAAPFIRHAYIHHFHEVGARHDFYTAVALIVFAATWCRREFLRSFKKLKAESHRVAFYRCCRCIRECLQAADGQVSLLIVDARVQQLGRDLTRFGSNGILGTNTTRQRQLMEHTSRVSDALDRGSAKILQIGVDELPQLARILFSILDRMSAGRWLNLINDAELPPYSAITEAEAEEEERKTDAAIIVVGASIAAILTGVAITLGLPAGAVVPAALIFLLGPATLWGSKKMTNPRQTLEAMKQSVGQNSETSQPSTPSASPTGNDQQ
jgi:hypothetical protein